MLYSRLYNKQQYETDCRRLSLDKKLETYAKCLIAASTSVLTSTTGNTALHVKNLTGFTLRIRSNPINVNQLSWRQILLIVSWKLSNQFLVIPYLFFFREGSASFNLAWKSLMNVGTFNLQHWNDLQQLEIKQSYQCLPDSSSFFSNFLKIKIDTDRIKGYIRNLDLRVQSVLWLQSLGLKKRGCQ